jgi:hypothetical protein
MTNPRRYDQEYRRRTNNCCACGNTAVGFSAGAPVCERCRTLEKNMMGARAREHSIADRGYTLRKAGDYRA